MTSEILHPGTGPIRAATYLPAEPDQLFWGRLPCATDVPVLEIDPGTEVTIDTISHEGILEDQGSDPLAFFAAHKVGMEAVLADAVTLAATRHRDPATDGPHVVTGPISVRGAKPGDLLAMTLVEALPRVPYGVISNRHGRGALPGELPRGGETVSIFSAVEGLGGGSWVDAVGTLPRASGEPVSVRYPLAPFLGIMGVATAGDVRAHSVPPGAHGGNIDIKLLTAGSTLYLPVQVAGALAYVGDPHFAQGDGEVALTALEASLRVTVRFDIVPASSPRARFAAEFGPFAETPEWLVPTGLDADLREAMKKAVRAALALLSSEYGMSEELAYAYLSAATDFDVSQVVDRVCGVHARIRKADFGAR
ncbi:acetamidase/formamidase family protein [soil metagenome]